MKEQKPEIIYSDPVKDIMGNPPSKIVRWGTSIIFIVFVLFIFFSWIIRYPDTIPAPVEITTTNPPVPLVSKITGHIQFLYVHEREKVSAGQLVGVMETTASVDEIDRLKNTIDTIGDPEKLVYKDLPFFANLGELQTYYSSFLTTLADLRNYDRNDFYGNKIEATKVEIQAIRSYINRLVVKEKLYAENQKLEARKYGRDSSLFANNVIPQSQLEDSHQSLIRNNIDLQQARLDHASKAIELSEKQQTLNDYIINRNEEREKLVALVVESFLNLKARINIWENNYLLVSPIDGVVTFTKFWSTNQAVVKDEAVINIVPLDPGDYVGRITLKMQRSGKVKPGQLVNIKLSGYPYLDYGMVRGIVKSISMVPSGDSYIVEIALPNGLTTLYGKKLDFTQNMQGIAEIITDDLRLIQKIINPFKYLISKNKRQK
ncbi:MAG TPA: HlyD family efflux transporter periplasmic adaptor subunit [Bacteroidales bacterium]|nr:HlyD family efflux transporter periplasmic adaptor subunit [Bacteroidales bacterium]